MLQEAEASREPPLIATCDLRPTDEPTSPAKSLFRFGGNINPERVARVALKQPPHKPL